MIKDRWPCTGVVSPASAQQIFARLSKQRVVISEKYLTTAATIGARYSVVLEDYLAHESWAKEQQLVCPEDYGADGQFSRLVTGAEVGLGNVPFERVSVHAAYQGSVSPMHFDWDLSRVHHLCVAGRRRIWVRPPGPARPLPTAGNSVLADFEVMVPKQRESILRSAGAVLIDLEVGSFVRFPSFWWHLVEYVEGSVAVSVRTELHVLLRPVSVLPRSVELQYLLHGLLAAPEDLKLQTVASLARAFIASLAESDERLEEYSSAIHECERELGLAPRQPDPWVLPQVQRNSLAAHFRAAIDGPPSEDETIDLCRSWLFGHWPTPSPLSREEATMLARFMAYAISAPH